MALFNKVSAFGGHGGDIWATDTFSFTSPINSLLNNGNYTLSQILNEDEVLQEVKNYNLKLIEFLSTETIVSELVGFISAPIDVNSTKEKQIKYPYMACEIFCCEVPSLLSVLAGPGGHLKRLFDVINDPQNLEARAVGYFEKVLMVLFKHKYDATISWINDGGYNLFKKLIACTSSHSVMNILIRLLLPRDISLAGYSSDRGIGLDLSSQRIDTPQLWCDWGSNEDILKALLSCITTFSSDPNVNIDAAAGDDGSAVTCDKNTRFNVAELLSSVISSCTDPHSSPLLHYMLLPCTIEMVIAAITNSTIPDVTSTFDNQPDSTNLTLPSSLIPLSVLYTIVDHLLENDTETAIHIGGLISLSPRIYLNDDTLYAEAVAAACKAIPVLVNIITSCNDNEMELIGTQVRRCGMVCLEAVKVLSKLGELVSLDCRTIEGNQSFSAASGGVARSVEEKAYNNPSEAVSAFITGNGARILLDAFQTYPHCSFLHEVVSKFVETVIVSSHSIGLQTHLVKDCRLLEQLIDWGERKGSWPNNGHVQRMSFAVVLAQGYQDDRLVLEETELPLRDIVKVLEDADPLQVEKWHTHVDGFVLPRLTLESPPLAGCTVMRGNGSVEVPLHFPEEPDSNIDDLAAIDVFNMLEEDVLQFNEDENNTIEEFPHLSKTWQEEELVPDFNRSIDFDVGRGVQESSQTHSNSGSLTGWANFPPFDEVSAMQTQQHIANFADFSTVVGSNPIDSSSLPPSNSSNLPCTISSDEECTKEPIEDETKMTSALRTVPFTANEVLADPIEQTEKYIGIKAKTV